MPYFSWRYANEHGFWAWICFGEFVPAGNAFIENEKGEGQLVPFVRPRALQIEEMPYLVQQYARGARNALAAKFD